MLAADEEPTTCFPVGYVRGSQEIQMNSYVDTAA